MTYVNLTPGSKASPTSVTFHPLLSFILLMCLHPKSSDVPLPSVKSHRRSGIRFRKSTSTVQTGWIVESQEQGRGSNGERRPIKRLMLSPRQEMMRLD